MYWKPTACFTRSFKEILELPCRRVLDKISTFWSWWSECVDVRLEAWVGANNACSVTPDVTHKAKMPKMCLCLCVCSASVETIANLCFHTSFWWCLVRDLIVLVEIWPSCNFSVASSARRFTFLYPRGSYYCCHTSHKGPKILTKPVAWLLKVIQLVCISLFLQFSSFDSLVRLITLQHL